MKSASMSTISLGGLDSVQASSPMPEGGRSLSMPFCLLAGSFRMLRRARVGNTWMTGSAKLRVCPSQSPGHSDMGLTGLVSVSVYPTFKKEDEVAEEDGLAI